MALKIDFGESDFAPEETPKAAGGTELMQKWLFDKLNKHNDKLVEKKNPQEFLDILKFHIQNITEF